MPHDNGGAFFFPLDAFVKWYNLENLEFPLPLSNFDTKTPYEEPMFEGPTTAKPLLFMPYETVEEARLRLESSVIRLHGKPIYVTEVRFKKTLIIAFKTDPMSIDVHERAYVPEAGFDLSPLPAKYFQRGNFATWYIRKPVRGIYRQGANSRNTIGRYAGTQEEFGAKVGEIMLMHSIPSENVKFLDGVVGLDIRSYHSRVLSSRVAVFAFGSKTFGVEYRGLTIGEIDGCNDSNLLINHGPLTPWSRKALSEVGINVTGA